MIIKHRIYRTFVCRKDDCGGGWWLEWDKDHPPTCPNLRGHTHTLVELAPVHVIDLKAP